MSLSKTIRDLEKRIFPVLGKDISDLTKNDFKTLGKKAVLGLAIPACSLFYGCSETPVTPKNEAFIESANYTIQMDKDELLGGAELSVYDSSTNLYKRVADQGAEDLNPAIGVTKVKVVPGTYTLGTFAPGTHADMAVFEDSSNNYVAHVDSRGRNGSITLSDEQTKNLNCYMMRDDFDKEMYQWIFQNENYGNLQRFPNGSKKLILSVNPADENWNGEVPQETYDRINQAVTILNKASCNKHNISIVNGTQLDGYSWLVHIGNYLKPGHGETKNGDIVLNSEVQLPYNADIDAVLEELIAALGAGHDYKGTLAPIIKRGSDLNDLGYRATKLASRSPIGSKY